MSSPDDATQQGETEAGEAGGELLDAPNQQVVRPDQSGPADEGEGGSGHEDEPAADQPAGEGSEPTRLATPDEQATQETPPPARRGRGRPRRDDDT